MLRGLFLALAQLPSPPFVRVLWRSLLLTFVALVLVYALLAYLLAQAPPTPWPWLDASLRVVGGLGLLFGGFLLFPAVATAVMAIFLDDVAEAVEREHYPAAPPGRALLPSAAAWGALRFLTLIIGLNLVFLPLYIASIWIAGLGLILYLGINGYLLGREYFELAALRQVTPETARQIRKANGGKVFAIGFALAWAFSVPFLNLLMPLVATAWMVHVLKALQNESKVVV